MIVFQSLFATGQKTKQTLCTVPSLEKVYSSKWCRPWSVSLPLSVRWFRARNLCQSLCSPISHHREKKLLGPEHGYRRIISHTAGLTTSVQTDMEETGEALEKPRGDQSQTFWAVSPSEVSSIWWVLQLAESEKCEPVLTWSLGVSKTPPRITHFVMVLTVQEKNKKQNW